jgi:hypothetical protein
MKLDLRYTATSAAVVTGLLEFLNYRNVNVLENTFIEF